MSGSVPRDFVLTRSLSKNGFEVISQGSHGGGTRYDWHVLGCMTWVMRHTRAPKGIGAPAKAEKQGRPPERTQGPKKRGGPTLEGESPVAAGALPCCRRKPIDSFSATHEPSPSCRSFIRSFLKNIKRFLAGSDL